MKSLNDTICLKRWQAYGLLGMSGFACGMILARTVSALGF